MAAFGGFVVSAAVCVGTDEPIRWMALAVALVLTAAGVLALTAHR